MGPVVPGPAGIVTKPFVFSARKLLAAGGTQDAVEFNHAANESPDPRGCKCNSQPKDRTSQMHHGAGESQAASQRPNKPNKSCDNCFSADFAAAMMFSI